jgi:hypothetical protein
MEERIMQILLIQSYVGLSNLTYDVSCSGRRLSAREVVCRCFADQASLDLHKEDDWVSEWYEVKAGDSVELNVSNCDIDDAPNGVLAFVVPSAGLANPPRSLNDERLGQRQYRYYQTACSSSK